MVISDYDCHAFEHAIYQNGEGRCYLYQGQIFDAWPEVLCAAMPHKPIVRVHKVSGRVYLMPMATDYHVHASAHTQAEHARLHACGIDTCYIWEAATSLTNAMASSQHQLLQAFTCGDYMADMQAKKPLGQYAPMNDMRFYHMVQYAQGVGAHLHVQANQLNHHAGLAHGVLAQRLGLREDIACFERNSVYAILQILDFLNIQYPVYIHNPSDAQSIKLLRTAKQKGLPIKVVVDLPYLSFNALDIQNFHTWYALQPPLRDPNDQQALLDAVLDGTIDHIASGHTCIEAHAKQQTFVDAPTGGAHGYHLVSKVLELAEKHAWPTARVYACLGMREKSHYALVAYASDDIEFEKAIRLFVQNYPSAYQAQPMRYSIRLI